MTAHPQPRRCTTPAARRRGSVYIATLGVVMLVVIISLSAISANRLTARSSDVANDAAAARLLAESAIDLGLLWIKDHPTTWRSDLQSLAGGGASYSFSLGSGTISLIATDTADGDLTNNSTDPLTLRGVGQIGNARMMVELDLEADGTPTTGTWRRAVD